jgi:signal transduction histidine kinase
LRRAARTGQTPPEVAAAQVTVERDGRPTQPIPPIVTPPVAPAPVAGPAPADSVADPPAGLPAAPRAGLTVDGIPKLTRRRDFRVLGGVAGGIADHLHLRVLWVRVAFVLLGLMSGAGVLAYGLLWIFVPQASPGAPAPQPASPVERRQALGIAAVGVAILIVVAALGLGDSLGVVLGPLGLAAIGAAFIWREADDARRARWRRSAAGIVGPSRASWWRLIGGCVLVVGGLSVFALGRVDFTAVQSALLAVVLTLVGVAVITIPWWVRLVRDLGDERQGRFREKERAEIAAHLHDSVLQTLALIQRQAADSKEVLRLARSQERQLRTWLYGPAGYAAGHGTADSPAPVDQTFAASLAEAAGEVEDTYNKSVTPVIVGDTGMDQHLNALVAASREAMVNAAKHAQVEDISVYAEIEDGTASVFVRDRGVGFDPAVVGSDRRGLAESIRGRMERHGGTATVRSSPGNGTEIELTIPVRDRDSDAEPAPTAAGTSQRQGEPTS